MIQIRRMAAKDVPAVVRIEQEIFSEPWSADSFRKGIEAQSDIYLVAEEDGEILGYCGLWGVIDEGQITNVAVAPQHRRRGVAEMMLRELMQQAAEARYTEFTLEVRVSNAPAIALYHKLGFHDEGIRKDFYSKPREDAIIMWNSWTRLPLGEVNNL